MLISLLYVVGPEPYREMPAAVHEPEGSGNHLAIPGQDRTRLHQAR